MRMNVRVVDGVCSQITEYKVQLYKYTLFQSFWLDGNGQHNRNCLWFSVSRPLVDLSCWLKRRRRKISTLAKFAVHVLITRCHAVCWISLFGLYNTWPNQRSLLSVLGCDGIFPERVPNTRVLASLLPLQRHLHKRLTNCFNVLWFHVTIVLHEPYGERLTLVGTVIGLVLSWSVTCPDNALRHEFELNIPAPDSGISRIVVLLPYQPSALIISHKVNRCWLYCADIDDRKSLWDEGLQYTNFMSRHHKTEAITSRYSAHNLSTSLKKYVEATNALVDRMTLESGICAC